MKIFAEYTTSDLEKNMAIDRRNGKTAVAILFLIAASLVGTGILLATSFS